VTSSAAAVSSVPWVDSSADVLVKTWRINPLHITVGFDDLPLPGATATATVVITNVTLARIITYDGSVQLPDGWVLLAPPSPDWSTSLQPGQVDTQHFGVQSNQADGDWRFRVELADTATSGYRVDYYGGRESSENPILVALTGIVPTRYHGSGQTLLGAGPVGGDDVFRADTHAHPVQQRPGHGTLSGCDFARYSIRGLLEGFREYPGNMSHPRANTLLVLEIEPSDPNLTSTCPSEPWIYYTNTVDSENVNYTFSNVSYVPGIYAIDAYATDALAPDSPFYQVRVYGSYVQWSDAPEERTEGSFLYHERLGNGVFLLPDPLHVPFCLPGTLCWPPTDQRCDGCRESDPRLNTATGSWIEHHVSTTPARFASINVFGWQSGVGEYRTRYSYPYGTQYCAVHTGNGNVYIAARCQEAVHLSHEYGHHVQDTLYGTPADSSVLAKCVNQEGWAHFYSGVSGPMTIQNLTEDGSRISGVWASCGYMGGGNEFQVAGAFFDFADGVDPSDNDYLPSVLLWDLLALFADTKPLCTVQVPYWWNALGWPYSQEVLGAFHRIGYDPLAACP
jgi:hypothetical protein